MNDPQRTRPEGYEPKPDPEGHSTQGGCLSPARAPGGKHDSGGTPLECPGMSHNVPECPGMSRNVPLSEKEDEPIPWLDRLKPAKQAAIKHLVEGANISEVARRAPTRLAPAPRRLVPAPRRPAPRRVREWRRRGEACLARTLEGWPRFKRSGIWAPQAQESHPDRETVTVEVELFSPFRAPDKRTADG
jgi:hypothetical protein